MLHVLLDALINIFLPYPDTKPRERDVSEISKYCLLVMATKQKLMFLFLCCLFLKSIVSGGRYPTPPPPNPPGPTSQRPTPPPSQRRCRRACSAFVILTQFCMPIPLGTTPRNVRARCSRAVNDARIACRRVCLEAD